MVAQDWVQAVIDQLRAALEARVVLLGVSKAHGSRMHGAVKVLWARSRAVMEV